MFENHLLLAQISPFLSPSLNVIRKLFTLSTCNTLQLERKLNYNGDGRQYFIVSNIMFMELCIHGKQVMCKQFTSTTLFIE